MKKQCIFLCIFFITCCFSQSIVCLKTGEIHLGEFLEMDNTTVLFQFYSVYRPQKLAIQQIEKLIFSDKRVLIQNSMQSVRKNILISQQEQNDLIANSTPFLIPGSEYRNDRTIFFSVQDATLRDKYDILVTTNNVIWIGNLLKVDPSYVEFRPYNSNVSQRVKKELVQQLIIPDIEAFYVDVDVAQVEKNSISYKEYQAMIQTVIGAENPLFQSSTSSAKKRVKLNLTNINLQFFPKRERVYNIADNRGYKHKHVMLVSIDNNMLYFMHPQKFFNKHGTQNMVININQIRYIKPVSKKINMAKTGFISGMIFGAVVGMADEYMGGPVLAILAGFMFGTLGTGIGFIIDIPFWIYDETQKVNLKRLSSVNKKIIIKKFIKIGGAI